MARVNIEDCWWTDPRRTALTSLLGKECLADGTAIRAWKLAQDFWKHGRKLIPKALFDVLEGSKELLQVGLADVRESFVYVRGSSAYLDWIAEKREQAKAAGKKSAESRRRKTGSAQPKPRTKPERAPNEARTEFNDAEPSVSCSLSGSPSVSDSGISFFERSENSKTENGEAGEGGDTLGNRANQLIRIYCEAFKARYQSKADITGKDAGIAKRVVKDLGLPRATKLIETYLADGNGFYLQRRHDLVTFEQNLKPIGVKADTGTGVTQIQARQADKLAHAQDQLKRIAEGKL